MEGFLVCCSFDFLYPELFTLSSLRQLEEELKTEKIRHRETETEYKGELERLRRDNERQQKLLAQNLTKGDGSNPETLLQSEIMRLTSENLVSFTTFKCLCSISLDWLSSFMFHNVLYIEMICYITSLYRSVLPIDYPWG